MRASRLLPMLLVVIACHEDPPPPDEDDGSPDLVGQECLGAEDCYPGVDPATIQGAVECLDRVDEGYCTHRCDEDTDCCAVDGECISDFAQVCSPFESVGYKMCFLSCEPADIDAAGVPDAQVFCQEHVSDSFICRSSGGGNENRDICVPGDCGVGAWCDGVDDCDPDFDCVGEIDGGWCGRADCASSDDCPGDSICIGWGDRSLCAPRCDNDGDCSFCRPAEFAGACRDDAVYIDGSGPAVCVPP